MAKYHKLRVNHDFVRGAEARVSVTVGATADMKVSMKVHAKTVSDVYNKLSIEKSNLSTQTWEKIKDLHVGGTMKFFFGLFDLIAGDNHDYSNTETNTIIQQNSEAQAISKAFNDADTSDVVIEGTLEVTGKSYVPTVACMSVNLTQVKMDDNEIITIISNNSAGRVSLAGGSVQM